ncbi:MAG: MATE family efflux transporter [Lachnospiraceae bacterium]|nr:MATE family efflux transporter [Lachnospiraceae bacterium]
MDKKQNFTEGKIFSPLVQFALPVLVALFLQTMYGAVDLLIVGQFGGEFSEVYVSAVSTGSQIMQSVTVVVTGLAMGLTVFVGLKIGAKLKEEAGKIIASGIWLFSVIGVALTIIMMISAKMMAQVMQAPPEAFRQTVLYIMICSGGAVFIVAYNLVGSIFRGIGDSKIPLITVAIACVFNIAGDLLLVAVFHLGAAGAALATVFAQAVSVFLSLLIIRKREVPFAFSVRDIRPDKKYIAETLRLGLPIALQDLLVSISFLVIIAIVNGLGLVASAGVGVAEKMCGFLMLVPSAFMQSMSAFVAQNIGAKKPERARKTMLYGIASSLIAGIIMAYLTFFHGELLAGIFAKETSIILAAADYLKAYAIDCLLTSFLFCMIGYFNGCGSTTFVMIQGIAGAFGVRIPVSWYMSRQAGVTLFGIGLATPISTCVQILLCGLYFVVLLRKQRWENE